MKIKSIYKLMIVPVAAVMIMTACTEETSNVRLDAEVGSTQVTGITSSSAIVTGFIVAEGDGITEKGICYDVATGPTTSSSKTAYNGTETTASYHVTLTGLDYATKYYARAYAISPSGTIYGEELSFTTLPVVPTLTTVEATNVTGNSASSGGEVTVSGGADVTAYGVCWALTENPTVADSKTTDGEGLGAFTSEITGLLGNSTYYVRAYATNSAGSGYGPQVSLTTDIDMPSVTTAAVTSITKVSAVSGGNVTYDGGGTIIEKGLAWSLTENPTTSDNIIDGGTGTGTFISELTGLDLNTTYHVRAYAINEADTAYGSDIAFKTLADITKFFVVGSYNGWTNSDDADYIISTDTDPEAQGYVYFPASGEFKLTTDHSWDDAHTFGDDGSGGLTNPGSNITVSTAGYQFIKASLADMTYSVVATVWGVVGDATPGSWSTDTELGYNTETGLWYGGVHLTAAEFKFRANNDWTYNYGSSAGDETLDAGGTNIPVDMEDDYAITLDLSTPNVYTYSAYRWGLIGDATGGWSTDLNMTWDSGSGVFTLTTDLVAGEIKFRANDGWDMNLGGSVDALTVGGANIAISTAGNYTITLDPWAKVATITLN